MIKDNIKFFFGEHSTSVAIGVLILLGLTTLGMSLIPAAIVSHFLSHLITRKIGVMHHKRGCSHHELL